MAETREYVLGVRVVGIQCKRERRADAPHDDEPRDVPLCPSPRPRAPGPRVPGNYMLLHCVWYQRYCYNDLYPQESDQHHPMRENRVFQMSVPSTSLF